VCGSDFSDDDVAPEAMGHIVTRTSTATHRADERYLRRGRESGHEVDDWLQAEHDVQQPQSAE
jgi:hypothetical protein